MNPRPDSQLLLDFAERRSDAAFAALVRRHLNLVHAAALRITRDPDLAKDVSQAVFIALANQAGKLAGHAVLAGWLHRTTRNIAAQNLRTETRRRARERMADLMPEPSDPDAGWQHIAPQLDAALADLAAVDRDAILLRYFENQSAREMADLLGIAPEAAQKRVTRAVERLREKLERRGIPTAAGSLAAAIAAYAVPAAPAGLATLISASALSAAGSALLASSPLLAMTTLQKAILATAALFLLGVGIHHLSSSASPATPDSAAVTPLPGKSMARAEVSSSTNKQRSASDPKTKERRRALADLKQRWLAVGDDLNRSEDRDALAKESVELLSCSPEAYELSNFLIEHEIYDENMIGRQLAALFSSPQGREARELLAATIAPLDPGKQHAKLGEWCLAAGKACPAEEFEAFLASLKHRGCAQEALLGRNFTVFKSDPEGAVRTALQVLNSEVHSLSKAVHLQRLFFTREMPANLDYPALEQLLPPDSGNPDSRRWTPTDYGRHSLIAAWGKVDPEAAARYVMAHPERMPPRIMEYIVVGAGQFGASASPLHWVPELPPGPYYDAAAKGVATNFREQAPEQAREIVLKMSDPKLSEEALKQLDQPDKSDGG